MGYECGQEEVVRGIRELCFARSSVDSWLMLPCIAAAVTGPLIELVGEPEVVVDEAQTVGDDRGLDTVAQSQLVRDGGDVGLDGGDTEMDCLGDLGIGLPDTDEWRAHPVRGA
jgi:hypothetical protein